MKKVFLLVLSFALLACFARIAPAQPPRSLNAAEIKLALEKLNKVCSVLYVAAHPDDENNAVLAYLANETKCRTGYLSLTRGEGGQNLLGTEKGAALGVVRTGELLAARRIDGAEQFFTRAVDFGFSKTSEETLRIWNKAEVLSDVVFAIRKFRPDVMVTRFPPDARAGHGHHQTSAILAAEAFKLAGDKTAFPEQLKFVEIWQPKRLVWNAFVRGSDAPPPDSLKLDVGKYNALLGKSYSEIAAEARSMHKTQGFGSGAALGSRIEYFQHVAGDKAQNDLFDGIETSWKRIVGGEKIEKLINEANAKFDFANPAATVPDLTALVYLLAATNAETRNLKTQAVSNETNDSNKSYYLSRKTIDAYRLIPICAGMLIEATASQPIVTNDSQIEVKVSAVNRSSINFLLNEVALQSSQTTSLNFPLAANQIFDASLKVKITDDGAAKQTQPDNFLSAYAEELFDEKNLATQNLLRYYASTKLRVPNFAASYAFLTPLNFRFVDRVRGEISRPVVVAPNLTANLSESVFVFADDKPKTARVVLKAFAQEVKGKMFVKLPDGFTSDKSEFTIDLKRNDEQAIEFKIQSSRSNVQNGKLELEFQNEKSAGREPLKQFQSIDYAHIPQQVLLPDAAAKLIKLESKIGSERIGYIMGSGDEVPEALKQIGYDVKMIADADFENLDFNKEFETIIIGIRAYNVRDALKRQNQKILDFAQAGGKVVVQYVTPDNTLYKNFAPFAIKIGGNQKTLDRVTDENSPIKFLDANAKILNFPNKITNEDFTGWVQERGLYFASEFDQNFKPVLALSDPNEPEQNGSLIIAKIGKGEFIYTGLSFFRELPAGVPGAYRLFVNLISK